MIFGKLENNQFVEYDFIKLENGGIIQTQIESVWFEHGYKSLNVGIIPIIAEGFYYNKSYTENNNEIIVNYNIMEIPKTNDTGL